MDKRLISQQPQHALDVVLHVFSVIQKIRVRPTGGRRK
jgi:hypothetical protein